MKNKILIVIPTPLAFKQFLAEVSSKLVSSSIEVHVACQYYDEFVYEKDVKYHFIDIDREVSVFKTIKASRQIRKIVGQIRPNFIHAHFSSSCFLLALSKTKSFPKCYATIQGALSTSEDLGLKKYIYRFFEIFALKKMDRSFVLTDDDYVLLKPSVPNLSLQTAKGFGVNLERFQRKIEFDQEAFKGSLGIDKNDFIMIYIGRLVNFKGFNLTIRIFDRINEIQPNTKLIVCGVEDKIRGLQLNTEENEIWQTNKNILKIGFTTELEKYLAIADLNIFPSRREGMPVNLMESIASEVPCITSNYRGCRHVVMHRLNGIVVEEYSVDSFTKEITNLISQPEKLAFLKEGCDRTRFLYDRDLYFNELLELYY